MYALCVWKSLNWPAMAVCQMLRARMELEVKCGVFKCLSVKC